MPGKNVPTQYRCRRGVSVRKSTDEKSPEWNEFVDYDRGDIIDLDTAPKHIDLKFLLDGEDPAIEEIPEEVSHG